MLVGQRSFEDLGAALADTTFCVVDIETTGGRPGSSQITEIGAVKGRRGDLLAEFSSLVDPGVPIPPFITVLTGITNAMVHGAPRIEETLPAFLEFAGGSVLVAHNASFDTRFLSFEWERLGYGSLDNPVVCTLRLARRLVRDEVPNLRLETLAEVMRTRRPRHRALDDARAACDVLHGLLELAARWGVAHLEDLLWFQTAGGSPHARKRVLTDSLPHARGVYLFRDAAGDLLYVGKAADLRARVRSYFSSDNRRGVSALLKELHTVDHIPTRLDVESSVLEARLIRRHHPPHNKAGTGRLGGAWVRVTDEIFPRITLARSAASGSIGPLTTATATAMREALENSAPIRRCNERIGPRTRLAPCLMGHIGRCTMPCDGRISPADYARGLSPVIQALSGDPAVALEALELRMQRLAAERRFEEAAQVRDRAIALVSVLTRHRASCTLRDAGRLVLDSGGLEVVVEDGSLASIGGRALPSPPDGHPDEARLVSSWLERDASTRLVSCSGAWSIPVAGGLAVTTWRERLRRMRRLEAHAERAGLPAAG